MKETPSSPTPPFVLAVTGASGSVYGLRLLQYLLELAQPVELIVSKAAMQVMKEEMDLELGQDIKSHLLTYLSLPMDSPLALYRTDDYGAPIASGSYRTQAMAVVPCSTATLAAVAHGLAHNLIHRAATVTLKERRPFLVLVREMPFGHIQLKNMLSVSEAGGIVACASPGFYHKPQTISDQIDFVVGRVLDQLGFDHSLFKRWGQEVRPLVSTPP